jgi:hypothetical protein
VTLEGWGDPRGDDEYAGKLWQERLRLAAQSDAKQLESAGLWAPPPVPTNLYDQLAEERPEVDWIVRGLAPAGIVMTNAQAKGGKTTLLLNAVRAMAMDEMFLHRFYVNVDPAERIGYLNMELPKGQFNEWVEGMGMDDDALKRIEVYHSMEYGFSVLDFSNDRAVDWIVRWLIDSGITILFADPLAKLYNPARWGNGADPNAAFTAWWKVLEDIARQAKLRLVWIAHHTGFSSESADRARGASSMMDNPTVNMVLRHNGDHAGKPSGTERYLKAWGRDVDVDEFEINYNPTKRRLSITGGSRNRVDATKDRKALEAYDTFVKYAREQIANGVEVKSVSVSAGELTALAGIRETDRASNEFRRGRDVAVNREWLHCETEGNRKKYSIGPITPPDRKPLDGRGEG